MITEDQKRIVRVLVTILRHTSVNPIKGKLVEDLTEVDVRIVAEMATFLYREGLPIGAGSGGYFKTQTAEEFRTQYLREINRGKSVIQKAVQGRKAQAVIGTLSLWEQGDVA